MYTKTLPETSLRVLCSKIPCASKLLCLAVAVATSSCATNKAATAAEDALTEEERLLMELEKERLERLKKLKELQEGAS